MKRIDLSAVAFALGIASALAAGAGAAGIADNGKWVSLTDGKSFAGWTPRTPRVVDDRERRVRDKGDRSHLFYIGTVANHEFKNFEFSLGGHGHPGSNGGIYMHTELQGPGFPDGRLRAASHQLDPARQGQRLRRAEDDRQHLCDSQQLAIADPRQRWFTYRIKVVGQDDPDVHQRRR